MAKKPSSSSKAGSQNAPQVQKKTLKNLTSKTLSDAESDKVAGGMMMRTGTGYSCGINCSTSKDPTTPIRDR